MRTLQEQILAYVPANDTEAQDKKEFLEQWTLLGDVFLQRPDAGHVTVSAMVLNPAMDAMLMVYHNIYRSWSWTGGHADGEEDLLAAIAADLSKVRPAGPWLPAAPLLRCPTRSCPFPSVFAVVPPEHPVSASFLSDL